MIWNIASHLNGNCVPFFGARDEWRNKICHVIDIYINIEATHVQLFYGESNNNSLLQRIFSHPLSLSLFFSHFISGYLSHRWLFCHLIEFMLSKETWWTTKLCNGQAKIIKDNHIHRRKRQRGKGKRKRKGQQFSFFIWELCAEYIVCMRHSIPTIPLALAAYTHTTDYAWLATAKPK